MLVRPSHVARVIDEVFPDSEKLQELAHNHASDVAAVAQLVDAIPVSCYQESYVAVLRLVTSMKQAVAIWVSGDAHASRSFRLTRVGRTAHPMAQLRQILRSSRDEPTSESAPDLAFVQDESFRLLLRRDFSAATRALAGGEWKSATVLSGSVIEALLLYALESKVPSESGEFRKMDLHGLVQRSASESLIDEATKQACDFARSFRNLIHPGREIRMKSSCTHGTAMLAAGAMQRVIEALEDSPS